MHDMVNRIKKVLVGRINPQLDSDQLSAETPLVGQGLGLDSVAVLELVTALEDEFDLIVEDGSLSREAFETIGSLADLLASQQR